MNLRCQFPVCVLHISQIATLFMLALIGSGCVAAHPGSQSKTAPPAKWPPDAAPASTRPDTMDAAAVNPADLVAHRVESYSQEMAPAIANRAAASSVPSQPSLVQWGDPSSAQLSLLPAYLLRPNVAPAPPAAVDASASSANQSVGQLASLTTGGRSEGAANSSIAIAQPPANRSPLTDPAKAQLASLPPAMGPSEMMQQNPSDAAASASDSTAESAGDTLKSLDRKLSRRVRDYPHDVSAQFDYQLLQFLMDQPVPNMSTISSLPDEDREMVSAVMDGLSNYRNNLRADNNMLLSRKVKPLLEMADRLRSLADLTIPTLALCQDVRGFGNYVPFDGDPPHFSAGVDHPVILYCEVQNFSSQLSDAKMWQTELVQDAVLYTEGGMSVWNDKTRTVSDTARNRRQDFFIVQRIRLPATLPMGRYLLKVTVEDKQSHHVAEATQPLLIVAE